MSELSTKEKVNGLTLEELLVIGYLFGAGGRNYKPDLAPTKVKRLIELGLVRNIAGKYSLVREAFTGGDFWEVKDLIDVRREWATLKRMREERLSKHG